MNIGLFLTNSCNFQCKHCLIESTLKLKKPSMSVINRFYEIVDYNKPEVVSIVGGEPLLFVDLVEEIVNNIKDKCKKIIIFSNGTFLLDDYKRKKVEDLGVQVRISKTKFHAEFWNEEIQDLIDNSPYWKIEGLENNISVFPRGRALKNNVYKNKKCTCSLVTNEYFRYYHNNRMLIMQDGTVNIWCPCMALELANVFNDEIITYNLLIEREQKLRTYLQSNDIFRNDMLYMCNIVCNRYRVTKEGIYILDKLVEKFNVVSKI